MISTESLYTKFSKLNSLEFQCSDGEVNPIKDVPKDVFFEILQYVPNLWNLRRTCRLFYVLTEAYCERVLNDCDLRFSCDDTWIKTRTVYLKVLNNIIHGTAESFVLPDAEWRYQGEKQFLGNKMLIECHPQKGPKNTCVAIWDLTSRKQLAVIQPKENESIVSWGCDGKERLFLGFSSPDQHYIQVWNVHTGECLHRYDIETQILNMWILDNFLFVACFTKDSSTSCDLLAFDKESNCKLWTVPQICDYLEDKPKGHQVRMSGLQIQEGRLRIFQFSRWLEWRNLENGKIEEVDEDKEVGFFYENVNSSQNITCYSGAKLVLTVRDEDGEHEIEFLEDERVAQVGLGKKHFYTLHKDGFFAVWDCKKANLLRSFPLSEDIQKTFQILSPNLLLTVSYKGILKVWDIWSSTCIQEYLQYNAEFLEEFNLDGEGRRFILHDTSYGEAPFQVRVVDFSQGLPSYTYPAPKNSEDNLYQRYPVNEIVPPPSDPEPEIPQLNPPAVIATPEPVSRGRLAKATLKVLAFVKACWLLIREVFCSPPFIFAFKVVCITGSLLLTAMAVNRVLSTPAFFLI